MIKLTHFTLFVMDQEEALKFYKKLGFQVHTDETMADGSRWLTICAPTQKDVEVVLMPATDEEQRNLVGNQAEDAPLFSITTNDIQATFQEWRRHSVETVTEIDEKPWGKQAVFTDLYGNYILLYQPHK